MIAEAEATTFRGHDGVRAWHETVINAFADAHWNVLDVFEVPGSDDLGIVQFHMTGTLAGVPVEQTMWQAVELRDRKVKWWALFRTEREALEAVRRRLSAMSQENVEIVRRVYEAVAVGDSEAVIAQYRPRCHVRFLPQPFRRGAQQERLPRT